MQLPPKNYDAMVKRANPPSPVVKDCLWAFFVGGAICLLGEALRQFYLSWYDKDLAGTLTSITLVMLQFVKEYSPKSLRNREGFWYNRRKPPREAPSWKSTPKTPAAKQWLLT